MKKRFYITIGLAMITVNVIGTVINLKRGSVWVAIGQIILVALFIKLTIDLIKDKPQQP